MPASSSARGSATRDTPPLLRGQTRARRRAVWRDHSARVRFLRRALPAAIALLLAVLLGWIGVRALLTSLGQRNAADGGIRMVHPKFFGRDSGGRSFTINALSATRDGRDAQQITLEQPLFILQTGAPKPTVVQALNGLYREDTRNLILTGNVVMVDSAGYRFESERALIDTVTSITTGETAVTGVGPLGRVAASSYAVYDQGAHVVFKGAVHAHLNNSNGQR